MSFQGSQDSNYSQQSSDISLDEEGEALRRETAKQALSQLDKARVSLSQGLGVYRKQTWFGFAGNIYSLRFSD